MSTGCSAGNDGDAPLPASSSAVISAPVVRAEASFAAGRGSRAKRSAAAIVSASASASPSLRGSVDPQHTSELAVSCCAGCAHTA